jgi:hypothetical protein
MVIACSENLIQLKGRHMANRTFLLQSNTLAPAPRGEPPSSAMSAGSNCIPVYWLSLFTVDCIVRNEVTVLGGRVQHYPHLVTTADQARGRSLERRALLAHVTPSSRVGVLEKWLRFIQRLDRPFIHLDTAELWMMDANSFEHHIRNCLRAFDWHLEEGGIEASEFWVELLDVAQIDLTDLEGTATPSKLAGYSWGGRPLPWE